MKENKNLIIEGVEMEVNCLDKEKLIVGIVQEKKKIKSNIDDLFGAKAEILENMKLDCESMEDICI